MIAAQQASGKLLAIIAQNRFTDAFWRLKAALDSGLAGKVCHAQWTRSGGADTATTTCGGAAREKRAAAAPLTTLFTTSTPFSGCWASRLKWWL